VTSSSPRIISDKNGNQLWRIQTNGNPEMNVQLKLGGVQAPAAKAGFIWLGSDDGLRAIDSYSGETIWRFPVQKAFSAPVFTPANGLVYAGCRDGFLYAIDGVTGALAWKVDAGAAVHQFSPIVTANREIVLMSNTAGGQLLVIIFAAPQ